MALLKVAVVLCVVLSCVVPVLCCACLLLVLLFCSCSVGHHFVNIIFAIFVHVLLAIILFMLHWLLSLFVFSGQDNFAGRC